MSFSVVPVDQSMLGELYRIETACFRSPWEWEALLKDFTENVCARYFAAFDGETMIGYGCLWLMMEEGHVMSLAVLPGWRRKGAGEAIMRELKICAKENGAQYLELECRKSNEEAQALYHKLGFLRVGFKKGYYDDTHEDAIIYYQPTK